MTDPAPLPLSAPRPISATLAAAIAVATAAGAGLLAQRAFPPDGLISVVFGVTTAVIHALIGDALAPRVRRALAGAEALTVVLGALAAAGLLGLLVVQGQTAPFYRATWGPLGDAILGLRIDDALRSLWFAGLAGVGGGTGLLAAVRRARIRPRRPDQ